MATKKQADEVKKNEEQKPVVKKGQDKVKARFNRELYKVAKKETKESQNVRYDTGVSKTKNYVVREFETGKKGSKPVIKRTLVGIKTTGGKKKGIVVD